MPQNAVIMLEFNELTPSLIHQFMEQGKLPNFRRFYEESEAYTTDAEEDPPRLEPWIQWVTVHSGLPYREHRVFYLNDGHALKEKCIWDLVSDSGMPVWICGSMNVRYDLPFHGEILPDPWSSGAPPYPAELAPYYAFVRHQVQEHTNKDSSLSPKDYVRFVTFMLTHGLSASTIGAIAGQLFREMTGNFQWKRTVLLDKLQWDLFAWNYRRLKPRFAAFFSNSVAHLQHCYWRHMEPWRFKVQPKPQELSEHKDAILYGYQETDKLVGRVMKLAGDDTTLIFCTALSQQPFLLFEDRGGKTFYRPKRFEDLLRFAGITRWHAVAPAMSEEFQLLFDKTEDAVEAASRLESLHVNGVRLVTVYRRDTTVYSGCNIHVALSPEARISYGLEKHVPFHDLFYQAGVFKSGMHHRDGLLWIRQPSRRHEVHRDKVSIRFIAPTVLSLLNVRKPDTMQKHSLVPDA